MPTDALCIASYVRRDHEGYVRRNNIAKIGDAPLGRSRLPAPVDAREAPLDDGLKKKRDPLSWPHLQLFNANFPARFFEILKLTRLVIYGEPSVQLKEALAEANLYGSRDQESAETNCRKRSTHANLNMKA
jgi:hypothetical protein